MTDTAACTRARRAGYICEFDGDPPPPATKNTSPRTSAGVDAHIDRRLNDAILYVGMNQTSAGAELSALQASTGGHVTAVLGQVGAKIDTKFGKFDLTDDRQVRDFSQKLGAHYGLPSATADKLEKLISSTTGHDKQGRDELGKIALYMARAESGRGAMPSRLVLSGHSTGNTLWGETAGGKDTGKFELASVRELGRIFPGAAKQVEDIQFGSCMSRAQLEKGEAWKAAFPNLKTMWGYSGFSNSAPVGDMVAWESASRGRASAISVGTLSPHHNASAWANGAVTDPGISFASLRAQVDDANTRYDAFVSGDARVANPNVGAAHEDYAAYRDLSVRSGLSGSERAALAHRADVVFRVRFYEKSVRGEFQRAHGDVVGRAFSSLGLGAPDFAQLSRKDALARIDDFRRAAGAPPPPEYAEAARHLEGLAALDSKAIPEDWCH